MLNRLTSCRPSEQLPNIEKDIEKELWFQTAVRSGKTVPEENDGAGNTFKGTQNQF